MQMALTVIVKMAFFATTLIVLTDKNTHVLGFIDLLRSSLQSARVPLTWRAMYAEPSYKGLVRRL